MPAVTANGVMFEVQRQVPGSEARGPAVVFIHGLVLDDLSSFYFTFAGPVGQVADTVLYDLRGHGRTELTTSGYTVAGAVDDLFALIDELGITGPVHLVGNSYGGAVALTAACRFPERVASLVLVEAHYPVPGWGDEMATTMALVSAGLSPESVMERLGVRSRRKAERISSRADQLINHTSLISDLSGEVELSESELAGVACPVLCCYGDASDLIDRGVRLSHLVPGARLEIFEGATHSLLTERSAELRVLILDWIDRFAGYLELTEATTVAVSASVEVEIGFGDDVDGDLTLVGDR